MIKKLSNIKLSVFLSLLDENSSHFFVADVQNKLRTQLKTFETKGIVLTKELLEAVSETFLTEDIINLFGKLLVKSVNNIEKVTSAFRHVKRSKDDKFINLCDELLVDKLVENLFKGEVFQNNCSFMLRLLLTHRSGFKNQAAVESLLDKLAKLTAKTKMINLISWV